MGIFSVIDSNTNICDNVIEWDDQIHPWTPPDNHYTVNIDGHFVGIGWYYDPSAETWTAPPLAQGSFDPNPVLINTTTTLTWTSENATSITLSSNTSQTLPTSGTQSFTFSTAGSQSVKIKANGLAGQRTTTVFIQVAATQAELNSNAGVTVL
jgi:hypothetical protein